MTPQTSTNTGKTPAPSSLGWLKELGTVVVDLLFPPHCAACHRLGPWLCTDCAAQIQVIHPPVCPRCGWPLDGQASSAPAQPQGSPSGCARCQRAPLQLDGLRAYAFHGGPLRQAIAQLKYKDLRALAAPLGKLMGDGWASLSPPDGGVDVIVPVPLHAARLRERGYNQAALLAHELGIHLQRPVVEKALVRNRATRPQVELAAQARRDNVKDAFRYVMSANLTGKRVLLVDDVCTTGSTLEAACAALRDGGVSSVWAYTLARARGDAGPVSNKGGG